MKYNLIHARMKDKKNINKNFNKKLELFKLSIGNKTTNLYTHKKETSNQNIEIIFYKKYSKKNIGKMIYKKNDIIKDTKIFNTIFILKNKKKARIIINNKLNNLEENIENKKQIFKIQIKFLDIILYLNSMFENCKSLSSVDNFQNINTKYLKKKICCLFCGCNSLLYINDISNWNLKNINDISYLFYECSSLKYLPDISKWDLSNVNNIRGIFYGCSSLEHLPDISNWNTNNIEDMCRLFRKCSSLKYLPDISKWNISNVNDIHEMFCECSSLEQLPDISKWNTNNIKDMSFLFRLCSSLKYLPDISKWDLSNVKNICGMLSGFSSLEHLPDISKWNTNNIKDMSNLFRESPSLICLIYFVKVHH